MVKIVETCRVVVAATLVAAASVGCGPDGTLTDAAVDTSSCRSCDDGRFCNGEESCATGTCEPGAGPCAADEICDETADRCFAAGCDADGDGHASASCGGDDCDDEDGRRFPGAPEVCDPAHLDEDCDVATHGTRDADDDGFVDAACCNLSGDSMACGDDCDDHDASAHPGSVEVCSGADEDCDGAVDEGVALVFYRDVDGDGFGLDDTTVAGCSAPAGFAVAPGDCDDTRMAINPAALERCDGVDNDCDGTTDVPVDGPPCECRVGDTQPCGEPDGEGGFVSVGECAVGTQNCLSGVWSDCIGAEHPSSETCNERDDDCDGETDEGTLTAYHRDVDGDGYGAASESVLACSVPLGYALSVGDCDDGAGSVHPGASEVCNDIDEDCDDEVDEGVLRTFYLDGDGDGYGCGASCPGGPLSVLDCTAPSLMHVENGTDCRDTGTAAAASHPGGTEVCDGFDNDCDGVADNRPGSPCGCIDGQTASCGTDVGTCVSGTRTCVSGSYGACGGTYVGVTAESCDGLDTNCNGLFDGPGEDSDADGYADESCGGDDCDDSRALTRPGGTETCNHRNDDCDSLIDDGVGHTCAATVTNFSSGWRCAPSVSSEYCAYQYVPPRMQFSRAAFANEALAAYLGTAVDIPALIDVYASVRVTSAGGYQPVGRGYAIVFSSVASVGEAGANLGVPTSRDGVAFEVDLVARTIRIRRFRGGTQTIIAGPVTISAACAPPVLASAVSVTHSLQAEINQFGQFLFRLHGPSGCNQEVSGDAPAEYLAMYQPSGSSGYPTYYVGFTGATASERMTASTSSIEVQRRPFLGGAACVNCVPPYGY